MQLFFDIKTATNRAIQFKARLAEGENTSTVPVPYLYVSKWWWTANTSPDKLTLNLKPVEDTDLVTHKTDRPDLKRAVRIADIKVLSVPMKEANRIAAVPFIYLHRGVWEAQGAPTYWQVFLGYPSLPQALSVASRGQ